MIQQRIQGYHFDLESQYERRRVPWGWRGQETREIWYPHLIGEKLLGIHLNSASSVLYALVSGERARALDKREQFLWAP